MSDLEVEVGYSREPGKVDQDLSDAIDNACDRGQTTWLTNEGTRIAAIVPLDDAEPELSPEALAEQERFTAFCQIMERAHAEVLAWAKKQVEKL